MGFRFKKSINLGGGFKINLSKSGVGYSWGIPGYRVTKTALGRTRQTYSIPGTGISYIEEGKKDNNNVRYNYDTKLITGETEVFENLNISEMSKDDEILKQINKTRCINIISNICLFSFYLIPVGILLKILIAKRWKIDLINFGKKYVKIKKSGK